MNVLATVVFVGMVVWGATGLWSTHHPKLSSYRPAPDATNAAPVSVNPNAGATADRANERGEIEAGPR